MVEGQFVQEIVLGHSMQEDYGEADSSTPKESKVLEQDMTTIRCAHGDTLLYPLANIEINVYGQAIRMEAAVLATLPVPVLLGGNVPKLKQLLGSNTNTHSDSTESDNVMVVVTYTQAKTSWYILISSAGRYFDKLVISRYQMAR